MTTLALAAYIVSALAWLFAAGMLVLVYLRGSTETRFSRPLSGGDDAAALPIPPEGQGGPLAGVSEDERMWLLTAGTGASNRATEDAPHAQALAWPGPVLPPSDAALSGLARHEAADWSNWTRRHPEGPDNDQDPGQPWRQPD